MALAEPYLAPVPTRGPRLRAALAKVGVRRRGLVDKLAIGSLVGITLLAVLTPVLAPHDPNTVAGKAFAKPLQGFLLGTDEVGRDVFSRILFGLRTSWLAALLVIASGLLIGGLIGLVAGAAGSPTCSSPSPGPSWPSPSSPPSGPRSGTPCWP
jgi:peptide/nickel transport system permease protein